MRWAANIYGWHWRFLFPISAGFEVMAVLLFLAAASRSQAARAGAKQAGETANGAVDGLRVARNRGAGRIGHLQFR